MWHDPTFESIFLTCLIYAHPTKNKNEEKKNNNKTKLSNSFWFI